MFVLFEGEEEKCLAIGFGHNLQPGSTKLTPEQDILIETWLGGEKPICFGGLNICEAEELYNSHFLPLLEKQRKRLGAPKVTIGTSAKEYIVEQLASSCGWSRASEIAEEIIRMSVLYGGKGYTVECQKGKICLIEAAVTKHNVRDATSRKIIK